MQQEFDSAAWTGREPKEIVSWKLYLRLTDEEIQMFDKALLASTEHLYELKV